MCIRDSVNIMCREPTVGSSSTRQLTEGLVGASREHIQVEFLRRLCVRSLGLSTTSTTLLRMWGRGSGGVLMIRSSRGGETIEGRSGIRHGGRLLIGRTVAV